MLGDTGRTERAADKYLPYIGHSGPQSLLLENGAMLIMGYVKGVPFELADHSARNARLRLLNTVFRNIADDNVMLYTHLVRHPDVEIDAPRQFRSSFAATLDATYRERVSERVNDFDTAGVAI